MTAGTARSTNAENVVKKSVCADRILAIVQKLQDQIRDQQAEFQSRLKRTIEETEQRLRDECHAAQQRAVDEASETTRNEVTQTLRKRFDVEISELRAGFDRRLTDLVAENEALEQLRIDSSVASTTEAVQKAVWEQARNMYEPKLEDAERLTTQVKQDSETYAHEWRTERQKLQERLETIERCLDSAAAIGIEKLGAYKELERKLAAAMQSNEQLQLDLERAVSELSARAPSDAQELHDHTAHTQVTAIVQAEMLRVRQHLDEIEKTFDNPAVELGIEIRLNRERSELEAYLKGLRYSLGEVTLQTSPETAPVEDSCHA